MLPSRVAEVATAHQVQQEQLVQAALALVAQALQVGRGKPDKWTDAVAGIGAQLLAIQVASASLADAYLDEVLDVQGADSSADAAVNPNAFADLVDGGGSWLLNLVYAPNSIVQEAPTKGLTGSQVLSQFSYVAQTIVATGVQDTGRAAVQTGMQARRSAKGFVRMLRRPSCGRCIILAGRRYKRQTAFRRHLNCDCVHVPAAEDADDWSTDPKRYFRSLSREEQDQAFGKASAEAIRMGADMNQVVNARQGITTVSAYGREAQATTVGTTTRGLAGQRLAGEGLAKSGRYRRATTPRLLPDEIFRLADEFSWDRAEVLRQLRRFGYLI